MGLNNSQTPTKLKSHRISKMSLRALKAEFYKCSLLSGCFLKAVWDNASYLAHLISMQSLLPNTPWGQAPINWANSQRRKRNGMTTFFSQA